MDKQAIRDILMRYRTGDCTEAEQHLVESWIVYGAADPLDLSDAQLLDDLLDIRLRLERDLPPAERTRAFSIRKWLPYAAAIVLIVSAGLWLFSNPWVGSNEPLNKGKQITDIAPGGNRATLTLADGRTIDLSETQQGIAVGDDVTTYLDGSKLIGSGNLEVASVLHSITTPKGGTYQIKLADGTTVWLNAASTLKYPSRFDEKERVVELRGEAYFDVRHTHNTPFRVITRGHAVEVLGTQFNVSAYTEEAETKTTLVEGSVRIETVGRTTNHTAILRSGQQSTVSEAGVAVADVDVSPFIGWKEGFFVFKGTELREAMKEVGRWYDVEVVYEGSISQTPFYGKISREDTLAEVLAILKEGKVNFRIEQQGTINRLIVMP